MIFAEKIISVSRSWLPVKMCAGIYTTTRVYQATYNTSDEWRGEMRAAAAKNTARTHAGCSSVHAGRHSTSDWHWCRANDILHPLAYEPTGLHRQERRAGSIVFPERSRTNEKKSCVLSLFLCAGPPNEQNNERTKILEIAGVEPHSRVTSISATVKQLLDVPRKT